jgi:hypothetical protein
MVQKEELTLVVTKDPKLESVMESYVIRCTGVPISETNFSQNIEIWSSDKTKLQELALQIGYGTIVELFGIQRNDCFRVSLDYGGKAGVDTSQYQHNRMMELLIKNIENEYVAFIENPLLHYLSQYPFKNGKILNSLCSIGASCGKRGKHHSVNGGLLCHTDEMLRLIKSENNNHKFNLEIAITAIIWHDLGKTAIVDENNPSELKVSNQSPIDHERMGLVMLGKAIGDGNFGMEMNSLEFRILCSTIGNIHNSHIYHDHLAVLREVDRISAGFSENNSIMTEGFKEAVIQ